MALPYLVQAEFDGVGKEHEKLQRSAVDARDPSGACGTEFPRKEKYNDDLVKVLSGEQNGELKKVILLGADGDAIRDLYEAIERQDFPT
ncbi:hypothetical protein V7S43_010879 [Phytophthora oleae]|uniref:Uncharacterized protein n=1 Tax=Phytophthora oleae TaxID=2107226 RepID=A0ABD3FAU4_9STRA